jgi:hypothetical protein
VEQWPVNMDQITAENSRSSRRRGGFWGKFLPPLFAALVCTGLIIEAIVTVMGSRANGDLMLLFVPLLGATFLSIPAGQAWWACFKMVRDQFKKLFLGSN